MRTFFPYQPNEVKHRKRTTRPQLKVLEDVYKHDKKPNASLRKKLADELGMTPRGVQVRFPFVGLIVALKKFAGLVPKSPSKGKEPRPQGGTGSRRQRIYQEAG